MSSVAADVLSERFAYLVRGAQSDGKPLTLAKIAKDLREQYEVDVTHQHLSRLLNGKSSNPGIILIAALSDYFSVRVDYFLGEDIEAASRFPAGRQAQLRRVEDLIRDLALLDDEALQAVRTYVAAWRELENRRVTSEQVVTR